MFISLTSEDLLRLLLVDPISLTSRWDSVIGSNAGISDDMDYNGSFGGNFSPDDALSSVSDKSNNENGSDSDMNSFGGSSELSEERHLPDTNVAEGGFVVSHSYCQIKVFIV